LAIAPTIFFIVFSKRARRRDAARRPPVARGRNISTAGNRVFRCARNAFVANAGGSFAHDVVNKFNHVTLLATRFDRNHVRVHAYCAAKTNFGNDVEIDRNMRVFFFLFVTSPSYRSRMVMTLVLNFQRQRIKLNLTFPCRKYRIRYTPVVSASVLPKTRTVVNTVSL